MSHCRLQFFLAVLLAQWVRHLICGKLARGHTIRRYREDFLSGLVHSLTCLTSYWGFLHSGFWSLQHLHIYDSVVSVGIYVFHIVLYRYISVTLLFFEQTSELCRSIVPLCVAQGRSGCKASRVQVVISWRKFYCIFILILMFFLMWCVN